MCRHPENVGIRSAQDRGGLCRGPLFPVLRALLFLLLVASADAQPEIKKGKGESAIINKWAEALRRVAEGEPWADIASQVEQLLAGAEETPNVAMIRSCLDAIRLAATTAPPDLPPDPTPEQLVAALPQSTVVNMLAHVTLISQPLHLEGSRDGVSRHMHWAQLAESPEHGLTDPAVRILKRGRTMVPLLMDALTDMTVTRTVHTLTGNKPATLFRQCDLAMAVLEAVTRCKFHVITPEGGYLSQRDDEARHRIVDSVREWWEATKDLPDVEARCWLASRVEFEQAHSMVTLLLADGFTSEGIELWRRFLIDGEGGIRKDVVRALATAGDRTGVDMVAERVAETNALTSDQASLLVELGERREYLLLQRLVINDLPRDPQNKNQISGIILKTLTTTTNPLAIPVFAAALDATDPINPRHELAVKVQSDFDSRPDLAAHQIQRLSQRDFRYDPDANPELRTKAIERVREWWRGEGESLYGFDGVRTRRGGIR